MADYRSLAIGFATLDNLWCWKDIHYARPLNSLPPAWSSTGLHIFQLDLLGFADYILFVIMIGNVCASLIGTYDDSMPRHMHAMPALRLESESLTLLYLLQEACKAGLPCTMPF